MSCSFDRSMSASFRVDPTYELVVGVGGPTRRHLLLPAAQLAHPDRDACGVKVTPEHMFVVFTQTVFAESSAFISQHLHRSGESWVKDSGACLCEWSRGPNFGVRQFWKNVVNFGRLVLTLPFLHGGLLLLITFLSKY
eukprot:gb/GEZN01008333.1/.p1 GENE.gb/GEZN01008333.1/~~gb/GEZN01008333.1/.p1  ORF type:complete len:138 (+),score=1.96 gb/GEZN01008333.1/:941-1354(+)